MPLFSRTAPRLFLGLAAVLVGPALAAPSHAVPVTYTVVDAPLNATLSGDYQFTFKISGISNPSRSGSLTDVPLSSEGSGAIVADWGTPRTQLDPGVWDQQLEVAAGDFEISYEDRGGTQDNLGFSVRGVNFNLVLAVTIEELTLTFEEDFLANLGDESADSWLAFDTVDLGVEARIGLSLSGTLGNFNTSVVESVTLDDAPWIMTLARTFAAGSEDGSELTVPNLAGLAFPVDDFRYQIGSCPIPLCNGVNVDIEDLTITLGETSVAATSSALIPTLPETSPVALLTSVALLVGVAARRRSQ